MSIFNKSSSISLWDVIYSADTVIGATNSTSIAFSTRSSSGFWGKPPLPISTNSLSAVWVQAKYSLLTKE
ncbi:MAG: hypothetical protein AB4206_20135 [Xenococcaceae cyanobacterium]